MGQEFPLQTAALGSERIGIRLLREEKGTRTSEGIKKYHKLLQLLWGHGVWGELRPRPLWVPGNHSLTEQALRLSEVVLDSQGKVNQVQSHNLLYDSFPECLRIVQSFQ